MTTNQKTSTRRRFTTAALMVAAGAISFGGLGLAAPANATSGGQYAAIAYSPETGAYGFTTNESTWVGANVGALSQCRNNGGRHCRPVASVKNGCVALAVDSHDAIDPRHFAGGDDATKISAMTAALNNNGGGHIKIVTC